MIHSTVWLYFRFMGTLPEKSYVNIQHNWLLNHHPFAITFLNRAHHNYLKLMQNLNILDSRLTSASNKAGGHVGLLVQIDSESPTSSNDRSDLGSKFQSAMEDHIREGPLQLPKIHSL